MKSSFIRICNVWSDRSVSNICDRYGNTFLFILLTHCSLETPKRVLANSADPDQTQQNPASGQGLHCLQIV